MPYQCFSAPPSPKGKDIPPTRARRALFPGGKGETKVILCKGLRPLHPRGWVGRGTGEGGEPRARRGACPLQGGGRGHPGAQRRACPVGCPLTLPLACFSAPYPPIPFPGGEGGDFRLFYARGFAPCIPGAGRGAALGKGANHAPGGERARLVACLPCLCFLFCPLSPYPLPRWGRGRPRLFYARGFAPCIPAAEPIRRGFDLWKTVSFGYAKDLSLQ